MNITQLKKEIESEYHYALKRDRECKELSYPCDYFFGVSIALGTVLKRLENIKLEGES